MIIQEQVDRAYRVAYRRAYPGRSASAGPAQAGPTRRGGCLAKRHRPGGQAPYKPGLTLVYGGVGRRENHRQAAARELREEVGITINPDALRLVMATPNMHLYELRLTEKPTLQIDRREVVEACFMHPDGLREARRGGKVGEYVRRSAARPSSA